jgi:hypothetical protein
MVRNLESHATWEQSAWIDDYPFLVTMTLTDPTPFEIVKRTYVLVYTAEIRNMMEAENMWKICCTMAYSDEASRCISYIVLSNLYYN